MLSRIAKLLLVSTSLAPILVTWAFADWRVRGPALAQLGACLSAGGLLLLCALILRGSETSIAAVSFEAASVRTADTEVVGFLLAYLLPLISLGTATVDMSVLVFVAVLLALVIWSANAYTVNPLLALLGYHYYEVSNADGVSFLLISRRDLRRVADVKAVRQLTRYVLLDKEFHDG